MSLTMNELRTKVRMLEDVMALRSEFKAIENCNFVLSDIKFTVSGGSSPYHRVEAAVKAHLSALFKEVLERARQENEEQVRELQQQLGVKE